jgi:SAM-dependent methyltransferase
MLKEKQDNFGKDYFEKDTRNKNAANSYNDETARIFARIIGKAIYRALQPKRSVDIGCAKGYLVGSLNDLGIDSFGVDISGYAVSAADQKIKERLSVTDAEESPLPFSDNYADFVSILEVLEHLHSFRLITSEARRILKISGYLLISTPNPQGRFAKIDPTHVSVNRRGYWIKLFAKEGFLLIRNEAWQLFKKTFLEEFRKVMPHNPPTTGISGILHKMGGAGETLRSFLPYIDYFSLLRSDEIMLFRKSS